MDDLEPASPTCSVLDPDVPGNDPGPDNDIPNKLELGEAGDLDDASHEEEEEEAASVPIPKISTSSKSRRESASTRSTPRLSTNLRERDDIRREDLVDFAVDVLGIRKGRRRITRSELRHVFLEEAGILVSDACLEGILKDADVDHNGLLSVHDLVGFVDNIRPRAVEERRKFVLTETVMSLSFLLSMIFLLGSIFCINSNLRERSYGDLHGTDHPYWEIAIWFLTIGSFGFVLLSVEQESNLVRAIEDTNRKLVQWIKVDLPRFAHKNSMDIDSRRSLARSTSTTVSTDSDSHSSSDDVDLHQEQQRQKNENEAKKLCPGMHITLDIGCSRNRIDMNNNLDIIELRLVLESMRVFLPDHAVKEVFKEIDATADGFITLRDLMNFAESKQRTKSTFERYLDISKRCLRNVGFWASWSYLIGSAFFLAPFYMDDNAGSKPALLTHLCGVGCLLYLLGALGGLVNLYTSTRSFLWHVENANAALRAVAITLGLREDLSRLSSISEGSRETFRGSKEGNMTKLEEASCGRSVSPSIQCLRANRQDLLPLPCAASLRQGLRLSRQDILRYLSRESTNLHLLARDTAFMNAAEIKIAQREGAEALFTIMDTFRDELKETSNQHDRPVLDKVDLYDLLADVGVLVPAEAFGHIFSSINSGGDGRITLEQFTKHVSRIESTSSALREHAAVIALMVKSLSLWLVAVQVLAGTFQLFAAYNPFERGTSNLFLAGSFSWAFGGLYLLVEFPRSKGHFYDLVESNKFMFKEALLNECKEYQNWRQKQSRCRNPFRTSVLVESESTSQSNDDEMGVTGEEDTDSEGNQGSAHGDDSIC